MDNNVYNIIRRIGGKKYAGSSVAHGILYHDLPFDGFDKLSVHRKQTIERWGLFKDKIDFNNKSVIDLGCSCGAFSLLSARAGAKSVIGYDYDVASLSLARYAAEKLNFKQVEFKEANINLELIKSFPEVDIMLCLSVFMWFVKKQGIKAAKAILSEIGKKAKVLVFETAIENDGMAAIKGATRADITKWLSECTVYPNIRDTGFVQGWHNRHIFVCGNN